MKIVIAIISLICLCCWTFTIESASPPYTNHQYCGSCHHQHLFEKSSKSHLALPTDSLHMQFIMPNDAIHPNDQAVIKHYIKHAL